MTKLSININKLATLRNSRGKNNPDLIKSAHDILKFGGQGITVHPRPDERHIRRTDVYELKKTLGNTELNIEGYPAEDFLKMVEDVRPAQVTLVPDPPEALTSDAGWKVGKHKELLTNVARRMTAKGVRISVFTDPETSNKDDMSFLKSIGVDRVELYTERFAESFFSGVSASEREKVIAAYRVSAEFARDAGLEINAGHDLNTENLASLIENIPWIAEVSIGHALICDALYWGLESTIHKYLKCIEQGHAAGMRR